jgi:hypothetical protein
MNGKARRCFGMLLTILSVPCLLLQARANDEMHPGARLFYPLWDVSTPNRLTFIVMTREALNEGASIVSVPSGTVLGGVGTISSRFRIQGSPGNCHPRGAGGSSTNINRTDLGGTDANPIFVDDLHFEYYGMSCTSANEVTHMSCSDIDLFLLASPDSPINKPRAAFAAVASEGRGALDVHLIVNGGGGPDARKAENALMGHAVISDIAEGWAATYPAAAAEATVCPRCVTVDGGTEVGYENYPMEVFLQFALADLFPTQGGPLRNVLSLWGPALFPGGNLNGTSIGIEFKWWDGRQRAFLGSVAAHSILRPLGGAPIAGLDPPLDAGRFTVANFVCGHDATGTKAENDGFPRVGGDAAGCGAPGLPDAAHPSDNLESTGDIQLPAHAIQSSTPIGWWRFRLRRDGASPIAGAAHSGRGLVGVVLSSTPGAEGIGIADAMRLWHQGACRLAQSNQTFGPPHLRDGGVRSNHASPLVSGDLLSLFNVFNLDNEGRICDGLFTGI